MKGNTNMDNTGTSGDISAAKCPICYQEGPIGELKARVNTLTNNMDKIDHKTSDILTLLRTNNENNVIKQTELFQSFRSIEAMLQQEIIARKDISKSQQKISEDINEMAVRVNRIELVVGNIRSDLADTKRAIRDDNEHMATRVRHLEKVSYYVYALGAVIVAITFVIIYGAQLFRIVKPENDTYNKTEMRK